MQSLDDIRLPQVQAVYSGPEGRLWELLMGEQIHIGGLQSLLELAERADIRAGWRGVDFCCCSGAGMRFLLRFRNVAHMTGVDATPTVLALAHQRAQAEGVADRTSSRRESALTSSSVVGLLPEDLSELTFAATRV